MLDFLILFIFLFIVTVGVFIIVRLICEKFSNYEERLLDYEITLAEFEAEIFKLENKIDFNKVGF